MTMSIKESVTIEDCVNYLNSLTKADPLAMRAFLCIRMPCNYELAIHPIAQISDSWEEWHTVGFTIDLMGIINGLFGIDKNNWGLIAYKLSEDGKVFEFFKREINNDS